MTNFIPTLDNATPAMLFSIGCFYGIVILLFWRRNITLFDTFHSRQNVLILLVFIHLLFAFEGGDYFHYYQNVAKHDMDKEEQVYHIIAALVGYDYLLFRTVVWGGALFFFIKTAKRFGLDAYKTVFLLYTMYFTVFDYARASLGMSIFFYGVSFLCVPLKNHRIYSVLIGYGIISISFFFHKSMMLASLSTIMLLVPFNKKALIVMLVLFAYSAPMLNRLLGVSLNVVASSSGDINDIILHYADQEADLEGASKYEMIRKYVEFATFYVPVILISFKIFRKGLISPQHKSMLKLFKITVALLLIATSTLMIELNTIILFYRTLFISMIPITILFCYARQHRLVSSKTFTIIVIICILNVFFNYSKRFLGGNL